MEFCKLLILILLAAVVSIGAYAQEAGTEEKAPVAPKQTDPVAAAKELFREVEKVIRDTSLVGADIEAHILQREGFQTAMKDDAEFKRLWALNFRQAFDHALTSDAFKQWKAPDSIGAEAWLRRDIRLRALDFRRRVAGCVPEQKSGLAKLLARVEAEKHTLSEAEYARAVQGLESAIRLLDGLNEVAGTLPEPGEAEKMLLEETAAGK